MKPSPSKTAKATDGKKRSREEATGSAAGTSPPVSPPQPDPNREWKKSKAKTEDLLALLNSGFLREKEVDMWRALRNKLSTKLSCMGPPQQWVLELVLEPADF
jgi:hypothetical protein